MNTKTKTSETSPIYINEIVPAGSAGGGWVAITFAPGKKTMGGFNYWDRDLNMDLERLRCLGADTLVAFLEDDELKRLKIPDLVRMAQNKGFQVRRFAFHDDGVPKDMEHTLRFIREIAGRRREGESVVMHCNGGVGRSGTMAACLRRAGRGGGRKGMGGLRSC
ncbi:MAG: dual specificity protein phosphatase family protein [Deltaproteobacteria bacterium]|nr:dual specificity protein phosphatase family protein [Deltaproteobacteria bacterium]